MRTPLRLLLAAATLAAAAAAIAGERTAESLRAVLPKFDPAKSAAAKTDPTKVERPVAQEGVTVLPDFKVTEKKVAQPSPDEWLQSGEVTRREVRRAEAAMNPLELALNRWHIPFLMPSFKDRVRAAYEEKKRAEEAERLESLQRLPGN